MIAVADTSFIIALFNRNDPRHEDCVATFHAQRRVYLPHSTLGEVAYLLGRTGGNNFVAYFLENLPKVPKYQIITLTDADLQRTAQILRRYNDSRVDFVDATVVAVAERLDVTRILTLDHRDFSIIRPSHADYFELLPTPKL